MPVKVGVAEKEVVPVMDCVAAKDVVPAKEVLKEDVPVKVGVTTDDGDKPALVVVGPDIVVVGAAIVVVGPAIVVLGPAIVVIVVEAALALSGDALSGAAAM